MMIRNGRIYTPSGFYEGDLIVDEGKIKSYTKSSVSI